MSDVFGLLAIEQPSSDRVLTWTESDLALMLDGIRQMEATLERMRADYRFAESVVRAKAC